MANQKISALTSATTPLAGTEVLPVVQSSTTKQVSVANLTAGRAVTASKFTAVNNQDTLVAQSANNGGSTLLSYKDVAGTTLWDIGIGSYIQQDELTFRRQGSPVFYLDTSLNARIISGNLIPSTAAKGVNFTANTPLAGMTSQLLNWYEEGTWTPAPNSGTFSSATGRYTRIGRQVTLTFDITVGTGGGTTMTAPIASAITTANGIYTSGQTFGVGTTSPTVVIGGSGSTIYFRSVGSAVGFSAMTLTASASITGTLVYFV